VPGLYAQIMVPENVHHASALFPGVSGAAEACRYILS